MIILLVLSLVIASVLAFLLLNKQKTQKQTTSFPQIDVEELASAVSFIKSDQCITNSAIWHIGISNGGVSCAQEGVLRYFNITEKTPTDKDILDTLIMAVSNPINQHDEKAKPSLAIFLETRVTKPSQIEIVRASLKQFDIKSYTQETVPEDDLLVLNNKRKEEIVINSIKKSINHANAVPPRVCMNCKQQIIGKKASQCSACKAVIYCSSDCAKADWKQHKNICQTFKLAIFSVEKYNLHDFPFTFYKKSSPLFVYNLPTFLMAENLHNIGVYKRTAMIHQDTPFGNLYLELQSQLNAATNLEQKAALMGIPSSLLPLSSPLLPSIPSKTITTWEKLYEAKNYQLSNPIAIILHHPLTVFHLLNTFYFPKKFPGTRLEIHLLGVQDELDSIHSFQILMSLIPGIQIVIRMIGPSVPTSFQKIMFENKETSSSLVISFCSDFYAPIHYSGEYFKSTKPDAVMILNGALMAHSEWVPSLRFLIEEKQRVMFTDVLEVPFDNIKKNIMGLGGVISVPIIPNPFRQPVFRWSPDVNFPAWVNGFIFGMN